MGGNYAAKTKKGIMTDFNYYVNLDERGEFFADVRDSKENTVFEIRGFDIFEDGFMQHKDDLTGLQGHLTDLGIIPKNSTLTKAN